MGYQPNRGNPENKLYFLSNNFIGGINTLSADDIVSTVESRDLLNMDLSASGLLTNRKGFSNFEILNEWYEGIDPTGLPVGDYFFVKVIKDLGNVMRSIEEFSLITAEDKFDQFIDFIETRPYTLTILLGYAGAPRPDGKRIFYIDTVTFSNQTYGWKYTDETTYLTYPEQYQIEFTQSINTLEEINLLYNPKEYKDYALKAQQDYYFITEKVASKRQTLKSIDYKTFNKDRLTNIDMVEYLNRNFILLDQLSPELTGFLEINEKTEDVYEVRIINNDNKTNLYTPNPTDLSITTNVGGYNVLFDDPKNYVRNHTFLRNIYGLYVTDPNENKIYSELVIPKDGLFNINVIFSGSGIKADSFAFKFYVENDFGDQTQINFTIIDSEINGALARFKVQVDIPLISPNTIIMEASLFKEDEPIQGERVFQNSSVLERYFSTPYFINTTDSTLFTSLVYSLRKRTSGYEFKTYLLFPIDYNYINAFVNRVAVMALATEEISYHYDNSTGKLIKVGDEDPVTGEYIYTRSFDTLGYEAGLAAYMDAPSGMRLIVDIPDNSLTGEYTQDDLKTIFNFDASALKAGAIVLAHYESTAPFEFPESTFFFQVNASQDEELGLILNNKSYLDETDLPLLSTDPLYKAVIKTPLLSDAIPNENSVYEIDDRQLTADIIYYMKYNGGTSNTILDFDIYTTEEDTKITLSLETEIKENPDTIITKGIDLQGSRMLEIGGRLVVYKGNTIWFSGLRRFNYFPSNLFVNLEISSDDEITSINYFRGSYIVFTKNMIWKMSGSLNTNDLSLIVLNDSIGCISPLSVRPFNNTLVFLSRDGLYRIKQNYYLDGLENVEKIDKRIMGVIPDIGRFESMLYNEQYILYTRDSNKIDAVRYYYNINLGSGQSPFVTDKYAKQPHHLFFSDGIIYAIKDRKFWVYDQGYTDFKPEDVSEEELEEYMYLCRIQTPNFSFGYPTHDKKFKSLFIKTIAEKEMPIYLTVKVDGYEYASPYDFKIWRDAEGAIQYEFAIDKTILGDPNNNSFLLGTHKIGDTDVQQHKINIGAKGKNITLIIEQMTDGYFGVSNIGYQMKLGKVRGE